MTRRVGFGDREPAQRPPQDSANGKAGWAPYLDPDEEILWTGQPLPGLSFKPSDILLSGFGLFFFSFAVFWTFMASGAGAAGGIIGYVFPLFGIPFIMVGGYLLFGRFFWEAYVRSKTRYALTNRSRDHRQISTQPIHDITSDHSDKRDRNCGWPTRHSEFCNPLRALQKWVVMMCRWGSSG